MQISYSVNSKIILLASILFAVTFSISSSIYFAIFFLLIFIIILKLHKEEFLILLVIVSYLSFTGPELISKRSVINILSFIVLSFLFIKKYGFEFAKYPRIPSGIIYLVLFLFFSLIMSTIVNGLNLSSIYAIGRLGIFFVICYFLYSFIDGKTQIFNYIIVLFIVLLILCGSIYYEVAKTGLALFGVSGMFARYSGLYENPNYVGLLVMVISSFLTVLFFKNLLVSKTYRFFFFFLLLNVVVVSILINSRAALLGLFLSISTILFLLKKSLLIKSIIFMGLFFITILQFPEIKKLFELFIRLETISERENLWNAGLNMYQDFPIFGVGPDLFGAYYFNYIPSSANTLVQAVFTGGKPHPHNFFLFLASENGILGLISAFAIFFTFFFYSYKAVKLTKENNKDYHLLAVSSLGICSGYFIRSFSDVEGILSYGYITRDLPFWLVFMFSIFIYQKFKKNLTENN